MVSSSRFVGFWCLVLRCLVLSFVTFSNLRVFFVGFRCLVLRFLFCFVTCLNLRVFVCWFLLHRFAISGFRFVFCFKLAGVFFGCFVVPRFVISGFLFCDFLKLFL